LLLIFLTARCTLTGAPADPYYGSGSELPGEFSLVAGLILPMLGFYLVLPGSLRGRLTLLFAASKLIIYGIKSNMS
jgi:hypothetical protein